jgi:CHAD domain-containing protein
VGRTPRQDNPFRKRLDAFVRELPGLAQGNVEALHRTRVASRRLREALPLLALDHDTARNLTRRLRKVTRQLGPTRELDVQALLIEELQRDGRYSPTALKQVRGAVVQARDASREHLAATLPAAKLKRLADKLARVEKAFKSHDTTPFSRVTGPNRASVWAVEARLARRAAVVRSTIELAGALYLPERLHAVRIAIKKLRYAAEMAREVGGQRLAADITTLKSAQGLLGRLHDLEALLTSARELQASPSPPDLSAWNELGSLVHAIERDCRRLHARYMGARAKLIALAGRMTADKTVAEAVHGRAAATHIA